MLRAETLSQFEMRSISWACSSEVSSSERCITSLAARWIDSMLDLRLANSASNAWKQTHATTITTTTTTTTTPRDTCNYGNNYNDYNNYYYNNYNNNTNYNHNKYNNNFSDTKKFDRGLSRLLHDKLHWLDVPERVTFKLGLMTLFARTSTSVPRRSYQASHRSCIATSTTFCQPTLAHHTTLSAQHVRPSGFSSCWSDGLELAARWTQRSSVWHWQFQTFL